MTESTGEPAQPQPTRKRWIPAAVAGAVVLILVVAIVVTVVVVRGNSDQVKIQKVAQNFASAVDRGDQPRILSLLCAEEAEAVTDDEDFNPANTATSAGKPIALHTSDIRISGNVASARITRPNAPPATLYFRKEAGVWKVCAPAGPATK